MFPDGVKHSISAVVLSGLLCACFCGCRAPSTEDQTYDFILSLPDAKRSFQLMVIDLSDPDDFKYLKSGWHIPQPGKIPLTHFIWSSGEISEVKFDLDQPEDMELLLSVRPFVFEGSPELTLDLQWNQFYLGRITLSRNWEVYRLDIPQQAIKPGENLLAIRHSRTFIPAEIWESSTDHRCLGASYAYFVVRKRRSPIPAGRNYTLPQILGEKDLLFEGSLKHLLCDASPAVFRFNLQLPSKPVLEFGAGILPETIDTNCGDSIFRVEIQTPKSEQSETLFKLHIPPPRRELEKGWRTFRRDLRKYAGQNVTISFETAGDEPVCPGKNVGSWLDPQILNRHVKYNVIFLIGSGPDWPPSRPKPGSALDTLRSLSWIGEDFQAVTNHTAVWFPQPAWSPLPVRFFERFKSEGWQAGYFFAGRDELWIEDTLSRQFDAVCGTDSVEYKDIESIQADCFDWFSRLKLRNFIMAFDPANTEFDKGVQLYVMDSMVSELLNHLYQLDTLFVAYNPSGKHPIWVHLPGEESTSSERLDIHDLDDLFTFILKRMDLPSSLADEE